MAQVVTLIDDVDQSTEDVTNHTFSLDGSAWSIDVSPKNLDKLTKALEPYITAARPMGSEQASLQRRESPRRRRTAGLTEEYPREAVRAWAKGQGIEVGERGRIKAEIVTKWREAGSPQLGD